MSHHLRRCCPPTLLLLLAVAALVGCGAAPSAGSATLPTPDATPTPTATPSAWQVYHGQHFTISYPPGWSYETYPAPTGSTGTGLTLKGPGGPLDEIEVQVLYGFTDSQVSDYCRPDPNGTSVTLAGIPMTYSVVEGVHRYWHFFNSQHYSYGLSVQDATQPQATQAQHDQILATFRPDDPTPGCSAGA